MLRPPPRIPAFREGQAFPWVLAGPECRPRLGGLSGPASPGVQVSQATTRSEATELGPQAKHSEAAALGLQAKALWLEAAAASIWEVLQDGKILEAGGAAGAAAVHALGVALTLGKTKAY